MTSQIDRLTANHTAVQEEVQALKMARAADSARIDGLETQVKELIAVVKDASAAPTNSRSHNPGQADPWAEAKLGAAIPPPACLEGPVKRTVNYKGETDWCHWVVGGWDVDSPKRMVQKDLEAFLSNHPIPGLERTAVYGRRTRVAHLYFPHAPEAVAKAKFFEWLPRVNKVHTLSNGQLMWVSPSRSVEKRAWNRNTGKALDILGRLCGSFLVPEADFNLGIIWLEGKRVATSIPKDLLPLPEDKLTTISVSSDESSGLSYTYNISSLARLLTKSIADVEASLRTE